MKTVRIRSNAIDMLKALCAFLIVCIHIPFPGIFGMHIVTLARIAVPIFFMITGYFYSEIIMENGENRQKRKIFRLLLEANLIYLLWKVLLSIIWNDESLFQEVFNIKYLFQFLLFNESPFNGHLWYLGAILYVLLIVETFRRIGGEYWRRVLYVATPLLLIGDLLLGKYSILLWGHEFPYIFVRNWLFVGMPYFSVGMLLREKINTTNLRTTPLVCLTVVFSLTTLTERFFLVSADVNATRDHYISTTFLAVTVFLLFLSAYRIRKPGKLGLFMAFVGRKYSTWVYIIHPIFITVFAVGMRKIGIYNVYQYVAPIIIYAVSICFVVVISEMADWVKRFHDKIIN